MLKFLFRSVGFFGVGVVIAACGSKGDCSCLDLTVAMLPDPIDVSEHTITFEVEWAGGTSTCVAGATTTECGSAFVSVVYDEETQDVNMGGSGIGQVGKRLPIVLGVFIEGLFDEVQVRFSEPEKSFSTHGSPIDSEESACGRPCTNRELALAED